MDSLMGYGVPGPILFRYRAGSVPVPQTDFIGKNSKEIALIDDVDTRVPSRSQFARRFSPATTIAMHQALGFVQALNLNHRPTVSLDRRV
jgi:hypothetical protein